MLIFFRVFLSLCLCSVRDEGELTVWREKRRECDPPPGSILSLSLSIVIIMPALARPHDHHHQQRLAPNMERI